jgi:Putative Actinobacterial Holin-X, holin superfamily III
MTDHPSPPPESNSTKPNDWQTALAALISARMELIRMESKEATRIAARKTAHAAILAVCLALAWFGLLAGLTGLIQHFCNIDWWLITLIFAALHFLVATIFLSLLKRPSPPIYPVTRTEFQKDQLWLQRIKTQQSKH